MIRKTAALVCALAVFGLAGCIQAIGPSAQFTISPVDHGYPPLDVSFDASASSSPDEAIVSYEWDFGDGTTATGVLAEHTYTVKGVYSVTLTVTDSAGKTGARTRPVEALNRVPSGTFEVDKYWVAIDDDITFDASASEDADGEIVQYLWDFGDGATGEGMVVSHAYPSQNGGSWRPVVTLMVVDEDGGVGTTTRTINVVGCDSCG